MTMLQQRDELDTLIPTLVDYDELQKAIGDRDALNEILFQMTDEEVDDFVEFF